MPTHPPSAGITSGHHRTWPPALTSSSTAGGLDRSMMLIEHACSPDTYEVETGGSIQAQSWYELHSESLSEYTNQRIPVSLPLCTEPCFFPSLPAQFLTLAPPTRRSPWPLHPEPYSQPSSEDQTCSQSPQPNKRPCVPKEGPGRQADVQMGPFQGLC